MTPSANLRVQLRALTDEVIPAGGSELDTRFTDAELDQILLAASTIESAAAEVWRRKAARAFSERGGIERSSAGDERVEFVSIEKYRDHCLKMAAMFEPVRIGIVNRSDFWDLE